MAMCDDGPVTGGFNDAEFEVWLENHGAIFTAHREELALLTGRVPLLLSVFARVYSDGDSWESVVHRVQLDESVRDWMALLTKFYANIDADLVWKVYTLSVNSVSDSDIVDFRFFYKDRTRGLRATNEIVMRLLYRVWTMKSANDDLLMRWTDLRLRCSNLSTLGFNVKEIIKAKICKEGVVGKYPLLNRWIITRQVLEPMNERETLTLAIAKKKNKSRWILLDPKTFHYPGVDMILVTDSTLVGINVTIGKTHSPLSPFFTVWRPLAESHNMLIKGIFVAPDNFAHEEDNVEIIFTRNVYHELWKEIASIIH